MTDEEMQMLEKKSSLWYLATGPIRLINMIPAPFGNSQMRMAILPFAILVLIAILILQKVGILPLH